MSEQPISARVRLATAVVLCVSVLAVAQPGGVMRFRTSSIEDDPRRIGGEAYRLLVPSDWRVDGNMIWHNNAAYTAAPWIRLIGPAKQEIGVLPPTAFVWNPNFQGSNYRPGAYYSGTEIQFPVVDPFQCIEKIVIPRYRRHLDNATVVKQELLPELAAAVHAKFMQPEYRNAVFQAGRVRYEYVETGVQIEEDVYVATVSLQVTSGQNVMTLWSPDEIRYSRAPKGTLDAQLPLFETCLFSLRPNLKWFGRLQEISQEYARLKAQASSPAVGRALAQGAIAADRMDSANRTTEQIEQMNAVNLKRYRNRVAVMDGINARWDRAAGMVEAYRNPTTGENVELPAGYNSAWENARGEYQVAANSNYDPESASKGPWTRLEKANP
jgi:hypothetical protein